MGILFLGVGNRERADDAVGPVIAEKLLADPKLAARKGLVIQPHSGEGVSLMHIWEGQKRVIIVDAMKSGAPLGSVHRFDPIGQKLHNGVFRYSSHLFGLAEAVEMSRALGTLPKEMIIFGIEGKEWGFGAKMSAKVKAALDPVEVSVREALKGKG